MIINILVVRIVAVVIAVVHVFVVVIRIIRIVLIIRTCILCVIKRHHHHRPTVLTVRISISIGIINRMRELLRTRRRGDFSPCREATLKGLQRPPDLGPRTVQTALRLASDLEHGAWPGLGQGPEDPGKQYPGHCKEERFAPLPDRRASAWRHRCIPASPPRGPRIPTSTSS